MSSVIRTEWNPTPAEFAAYKKREVEMAKAKFDRALDRTWQTSTLHSDDTLQLAMKL